MIFLVTFLTSEFLYQHFLSLNKTTVPTIRLHLRFAQMKLFSSHLYDMLVRNKCRMNKYIHTTYNHVEFNINPNHKPSYNHNPEAKPKMTPTIRLN